MFWDLFVWSYLLPEHDFQLLSDSARLFVSPTARGSDSVGLALDSR